MAKDALKNMQILAQKLPKIAADAMDYTMLSVEADAKRTHAFRDRTGRLRASIRAGVWGAGARTQIEGVATAGKNDASGRGGDWATASMVYAPFIELGTSKMSPRPFIWPAMQRVRSSQVLERAIRSLIQGTV